MGDALRRAWRKFRLMRWATSPQGLAYHRALDDVWDHALEPHNPCHDRVRDWIVQRRAELDPDPPNVSEVKGK